MGIVPTVILVGLAAGLVLGVGRSRLVALMAVGVVAALGMGLLVADDGDFVSGTLLAVPNYLVGVLMGLSVRHLVTSTIAAVDSSRRRHFR